MTNRNYLRSLPQLTCFEGEEDEGGDAAAAAAAAKAAADKAAADAAAAAKTAEEKRFSQKEVDDIVVKRNKTVKQQLETLEGNYQALLQQQNLTAEGRAKLESDLENVQAQMRTKDEQAKHEQKKAAEKHASEINTLKQQGDYYKNLFETSTVERAITDAAITHDGFNASQFIALLGPKAKIVEEVDKLNQKTGRLVPQITFEVRDAEGNITQITDSPDKIVERMKENTDLYGNMFKSHVARGVGQGTAGAGGSTPTPGSVNHKKLTTEEHMRLRNDPNARKALGLA